MHDKQDPEEVLPLKGEYLPASHCIKVDAPSLSMYVPAGALVHVGFPVMLEYVPFVQLTQTGTLESSTSILRLNWPIEHG